MLKVSHENIWTETKMTMQITDLEKESLVFSQEGSKTERCHIKT